MERISSDHVLPAYICIVDEVNGMLYRIQPSVESRLETVATALLNFMRVSPSQLTQQQNAADILNMYLIDHVGANSFSELGNRNLAIHSGEYTAHYITICVDKNAPLCSIAYTQCVWINTGPLKSRIDSMPQDIIVLHSVPRRMHADSNLISVLKGPPISICLRLASYYAIRCVMNS